MFLKRLFRYMYAFPNMKQYHKVNINFVRNIGGTLICFESKKDNRKEKCLVSVDDFERIESKDKNTYLEMVKIFVNHDHVYRRGHVEFIYAALKHMKEFGVERDLEVYKALIDVLPKGKFIPQNLIQSEFMHYPKQQQCILDLLEQMEDNGVIPDTDMQALLLNIFGNRGFPLRRYWRMMYWMPKFKNLSPWPVPDPLPIDTFELAKIAIERITSVDVTSVVTVYQSTDVIDSIDDTWIVSGQSVTQKRLLEEHNLEEPVYVEGPFKIFIKGNRIYYFFLRGSPKPYVDEDIDMDDVTNLNVSLFKLKPPIGKYLKVMPSVHEQEDGVIYSVCATGTSSKDSLLSWIRHLEKDGNPKLGELSVVFTLKSGTKEITTAGTNDKKDKIEEK